jgi:uncharacterized protein YfdQ (DUF2303 family)
MQPDIKEARTQAAVLVALGAALGRPVINPHAGGRAYVLLPQGNGDVKVEYLERPSVPERRTGTVKADDTASFIAGVNRYFDKDRTVIYASLDPAKFEAVLNDHASKGLSQSGHDGSNWRDHRVLYTLALSKEWEIWEKQHGKDLSQEQLAYFIEDNLPDFKNPTGAKMLEIATNFRVKQGVTFKSNFRPQDGQVKLEYIEQNEGGAGVNGNMTIPELFTIQVPVWKGIDAAKYDQQIRLRYRVGGGSLSIKLELVRKHKTIEQAFIDVLAKIKAGVKDATVIFGDGK